MAGDGHDNSCQRRDGAFRLGRINHLVVIQLGIFTSRHDSLAAVHRHRLVGAGVRIIERTRQTRDGQALSIHMRIDGHTHLSVCRAIVGLRRDGDSELSRLLIDGLVAVGHVERHTAEISVGIRKLIGSQSHVRRTLVGTGSVGCAAEREVGLLIEVVAECGIIAAYLMLCAVVCHDVTMARNGHGSGNGTDFLVAVGHVECHAGEIRIRIRKLVGSQTHRGLTGIGTLRLSRTAERKVALLVERITDLHVVAAHAMLRAVVVGGIVMTGDGDHHISDCSDLQIAVGHVEGHIREVCIIVGKLVGSQTHHGLTLIGAFCLSRTAERKVCLLIEVVAECGIIARHAVLRAVVCYHIIVAGDGHGGSDRTDFLIAVGHDEGHVAVVLVLIRKLRGSQTHHGLTSIGTLRFSRTGEREVRCRI